MRLKDAIKSVIREKERGRELELSTIWSEQADDERDIPLVEYPRPQLKRTDWECLNGWWEYAFTHKKKKPARADGRILVPFSPETRRSAVGRTLIPGEALWYRREVRVEARRPGMRLLLHFGAVDERCTVWFNRRRLGVHRGGYLPFTFDLTDTLREGSNELIVRVFDDTDSGQACRGKQKLLPGGMFYASQSGIWQTVWTEWVPDNYIMDMKMLPHPEEEVAEIRIRMKHLAAGTVRIGRPVIAAGEQELAGAASSETEEEIVGSISEADFQKDGWASCRIHIQNPKLWSPESPYLYPVRISLGEDEAESYFAMRSFGIGRDGKGRTVLKLNGKPYFFHGVLDQGYWPESLMTAPADAALIYDIEAMKSLGFNTIRKHVKIEPLRWYYHCDRLGMVVWQDMVNGGGPIPALLCTYLPTIFPIFGKMIPDRLYRLLRRRNRREKKRFEEQLLEMIEVLGNNPSIGMWIIFNEGWGQFDAARLTKAVKQADPTRPVDHASGWFDQGAGDVNGVHNYFRPLTVPRDRFGRVEMITEYGGVTLRVDGHDMTENTYGYHEETPETFEGKFRTLTGEVQKLGEQGLSGAVYTQVSDIEEEINGLLTWDRKVRKWEL